MTSKTEIRRQIRAKRRQLSDQQRRDATYRVCDLISQQAIFRNSNSIAFYLPNDGEMDITPLIFEAWKMKKTCYLPVLDRMSTNRLWFARYDRDTPLRLNRFNIAEPVGAIRSRIRAPAIDLLLMPLVAFDEKGNRLGMGGGYYDRTLSFLSRRQFWRKPHLCGVAYHLQKVKSLPREPWDIALDIIITESGEYPQ